MNRITTIFILLTGITLSVSCKTDSKQSSTITKVIPTFKKEGELTLIKATGDTIKVLDIEISDDDYQRQTGLMYRKTMKKNQGMLFLFPKQASRSFYMKNTYIALDIIYIDNHNKIVSIQKSATPLNEISLPSEAPAQYVLEINAGLSDQWQLNKGDKALWNIKK